jgi:hypothetical protein
MAPGLKKKKKKKKNTTMKGSNTPFNPWKGYQYGTASLHRWRVDVVPKSFNIGNQHGTVTAQ